MKPILCFIDDESEILETYSELFSNEYEIFCYQKPQDFIKSLEHKDFLPDAIITDYKMPLITGIDLLKQIRQKEIECPVLILSGYIDQKVAMDAANLGIFFLVEKPVSLEQLKLIIEQMIIEVQLKELTKDIRSTILKLKEIYQAIQDSLFSLIPEEVLNKFFVEEKDGHIVRKYSLNDILTQLENKLDTLLISEKKMIELKKKQKIKVL